MGNQITQILLIFITTLGISGQSDTINEVIIFGNCESGTKSAIEDFENEFYVKTSYGLQRFEDWHFKDYYEVFIKNKYGITLGYGGCIISDETICHEKKMNELILNKFGDDIFEIAKSEARIEYDSIIQVKIDVDQVFDDLDTLPSFYYGSDSLFSFLGSNLENNENVTGKVYASITIEKDGSIGEVLILKGINEEIDNHVIEVLCDLYKWNPGILRGQIVRSRVVQTISFLPE
ncbi:MAG: hypothetical protein ACI8Q1_002134 [Parvicella sp.]|jgi:hypothetical protein